MSAPTVPLVVSLTVPIVDCIEELNNLIQAKYAEGYDLVSVLSCPGQNWVGASAYHWIVIFKPKVPTP